MDKNTKILEEKILYSACCGKYLTQREKYTNPNHLIKPGRWVKYGPLVCSRCGKVNKFTIKELASIPRYKNPK